MAELKKLSQPHVDAGQGNISRYSLTAIVQSFRYRNYRFLWSSDGIVGWSLEIEFLVLGWFILVESGSPFFVGLMGSLRYIGTLLAPLYGLIGDRYNRSRILLVIRVSFSTIAIVVLVLSLVGSVQIWHIFVAMTLSGSLRIFDGVTSQSMVAEIVPRAWLSNAISLSRITKNTAHIGAAVLGSRLLQTSGLGPSYAVIAVLHLIGSILTYPIRLERCGQPFTVGLIKGMKQGTIYVWRHDKIPGILFLAFVVNMTAFPISTGLLPVIARDLYDAGPQGLATIAASIAIGALAAAVLLAWNNPTPKTGRILFTSIGCWYLLLLVLVNVDDYLLALFILLAIGFSTSFCMIFMHSLLLRVTSTRYVGRVIGYRGMAIYGLPIGLFCGGLIAETIGVRAAITTNAILGLALTLFAGIRWRGLIR